MKIASLIFYLSILNVVLNINVTDRYYQFFIKFQIIQKKILNQKILNRIQRLNNLEIIYKKRKDRNMSNQNNTQGSLQSISIKLTQSNLPSATLIKTSQQHISLTYTVSIENISEQKIQFPYARESHNLLISIQSKKDGVNQKASRYRKIKYKEDDHQLVLDKDVFKKKSILKVSNFDLSVMLHSPKIEQSPVLSRVKKTPIKGNNSGLIFKTKSPKNKSMIQSKIYSKSKQLFNKESTQNHSENIFMRTTRFYSLKNDKIIEPKNDKKGPSIRKQIQKNYQNFQTDRKHNRLPIIKGTNFHSSAPASMNAKRKVLSCHENVQLSDKNIANLSQKMILGKPCKINQNDQKAKKYLQKIIQNRNSIIHPSQNKSNKINFRQFKQNFDEWF